MANPNAVELQKGVHVLLKDPSGVPISADADGAIETFTIWNCADQSIFQIPNDAETRSFFGIEPAVEGIISEPTTSNSTANICKPGRPYKKTVDAEPVARTTGVQLGQKSIYSSSSMTKAVASWKDDAAVRSLILKWKEYETLFQSGTIRHEMVWRMIADDMSNLNADWIYTGIQCENKFKDLRKSWVRIRDHNKQTGAEVRTCKFFEEMDEILGEKPCVMPVTLASNLNKRSKASCSGDKDDGSDHGNVGQSDHLNKNKKVKKTRVQRELGEWSETLRADAHRREEAREQRHVQCMDTFKQLFSKLIDKL